MKAPVEASTASVEASTKASREDMEASTKASMEDMEASTKDSTEALPRIQKLPRKHFHGFRLLFHGSKRQLPPKARSSAASTKASTKAFRESSRSSFHETLEATSTELATSTEFYVILPWKLP